ncbi:MAG: single-stranded DNA-binding protein [Kiritimatiellae bacterium]|nr:single-stranded DNA-binding protein [Kiritimatiellia bacterium]
MSALNVNRVCLAGHLTRDPVLRTTASGTAVTDMRLAINDSFTAKDGKPVEQTCFVDVTAWARTAEIAHQHLHKGDPMLVEGSLVYEEWETDKGVKRNQLRVRVSRLHFVGGRRNGNDAGAPTADNAAPPAAEMSADAPMPF